jgi:hypothetical protein
MTTPIRRRRRVAEKSADYTRLEIVVPTAAVDPGTGTVRPAELLRQIAIALDDHTGAALAAWLSVQEADNGSATAAVAETLAGWVEHLKELVEQDRHEAFLEYDAMMTAEFGPIPEEKLRRNKRAAEWYESIRPQREAKLAELLGGR